MKKYLPDLFTGIGLGLFVFILGGLTSIAFASLKYWTYYAVMFLVLFGGYFVYFRHPKKINLIPSLLIFLLGFVLPPAVWMGAAIVFIDPQIG